MAVARSLPGGVATRPVLPVLWITSGYRVVGPMAQATGGVSDWSAGMSGCRCVAPLSWSWWHGLLYCCMYAASAACILRSAVNQLR